MRIKLVQIRNSNGQRRIALVDEPELRLLRKENDSVFRFASRALEGGEPIADLIELSLTGDKLLYDDVYYGQGEWVFLPCFDHPDNPLQCMVSGTGLAHMAGAGKRHQMRHLADNETMVDSITDHKSGEEGSRPLIGRAGIQSEWFYKGNGTLLKGHGTGIDVPFFAEDAGEEAVIAGLYLVDGAGQPTRIGFCQGNDFSDHNMASKNEFYLAHSKLRSCAIGPEMVMAPYFCDVSGRVSIVRRQEVLWERDLQSGENQMGHSLENIEFNHFKYTQHCVPGQVHIHFFGTGASSYGAPISLAEGDIVRTAFNGYGRPLENNLHFEKNDEEMQAVRSLL